MSDVEPDEQPARAEPGALIAALRHEYSLGGLDVADLAPDPMMMFGRWLNDALEAELHEPNAMVVATADAQGHPSARMVLLKALDDGFVFFTNRGSRKGHELEENAACALLFPWHPLERQVRVEGDATLLGRDEVERYFRTRPRGAQLGAVASLQSQPVGSRAELDAAHLAAEAQYADREVPVPAHWGGYRVVPESIEFWQGRADRMHDRLVYLRSEAGWTIQRLAP